jgi:hypothetical protein
MLVQIGGIWIGSTTGLKCKLSLSIITQEGPFDPFWIDTFFLPSNLPSHEFVHYKTFFGLK